MSTQTNLIQFKKYLLSLEQSGCYDVEKYTHSLMFQTSQLAFFFCQLVKDHNVDHTFYHVHHKPKIHTLAYFNIGRGYPKELQDGHWCYVLKDFGYKMLIVRKFYSLTTKNHSKRPYKGTFFVKFFFFHFRDLE